MPANSVIALAAIILLSTASAAQAAEVNPENLLLKDYRPRSIFNIPQTHVEKARYPVIDVHTHAYLTNKAGVDRWVQTMNATGIERSIILTGATGTRFDALVAVYSRYPNRFELWCGLDLSGPDEPAFADRVIAELERCIKVGAKGIGELSDKGSGLRGGTGLHCDDARLDPVFKRCAELRIPINIHIGEDQWMYESMDQHNDGLMNAYKWQIPKDPAVLGHEEVLATLENMLKKHPQTTFIACHLANCCADLPRLGGMLDRYPNLHVDIGARFAELAPIPRTVNRFFTKYQDRILYGTDNSPEAGMYRTSFRILETDDEHFYPQYFAKYHWPHHGFALSDDVLRKVYRENALKLFGGSQ